MRCVRPSAPRSAHNAGAHAPDPAPHTLRQAVARAARRDADEGRDAAYRALVRVRNELQYLDMHVHEHPMRLLRPEARRLGCLPTGELRERIGGAVRVAALLAATRRVPTPQGEMRFLTFEDEQGLVEGVLFPDENAHLGERLTTPGPYLVSGTMREADGDEHLVVQGLAPFHERG